MASYIYVPGVNELGIIADNVDEIVQVKDRYGSKSMFDQVWVQSPVHRKCLSVTCCFWRVFLRRRPPKAITSFSDRTRIMLVIYITDICIVVDLTFFQVTINCDRQFWTVWTAATYIGCRLPVFKSLCIIKYHDISKSHLINIIMDHVLARRFNF